MFSNSEVLALSLGGATMLTLSRPLDVPVHPRSRSRLGTFV